MIGRTVVVTLAGEEIGRHRVHLMEPSESGRRTPPQVADFIVEARKLLAMRGLSRDDLDRAEFAVIAETPAVAHTRSPAP